MEKGKRVTDLHEVGHLFGVTFVDDRIGGSLNNADIFKVLGGVFEPGLSGLQYADVSPFVDEDEEGYDPHR